MWKASAHPHNLIALRQKGPGHSQKYKRELEGYRKKSSKVGEGKIRNTMSKESGLI